MQHTDQFVFPRESMIWQINREQVLLLSGARVLLMQIAHPLVAEAVYEHSYVFQKPLKRLHRTLELTLGMVFGTQQEVQDAASSINAAHRPAHGTLHETVGSYPAQTPYHARDPKLAMWVFTTLVEGAITAYETFLRPLTPEERQAFYEDSKQVVALLGVRRDFLPETIEELYAYMDDMIASGEVIVSPRAREIAPFVMGQWSPIMRVLSHPISRLTVGLLPDPIREQYGYAFPAWEERVLRLFLRTTRQIVPRLPGIMRYVPLYRRACRLLATTS